MDSKHRNTCDRVFWSTVLRLTIVMPIGIIAYPNHNKHLCSLLAHGEELIKPWSYSGLEQELLFSYWVIYILDKYTIQSLTYTAIVRSLSVLHYAVCWHPSQAIWDRSQQDSCARLLWWWPGVSISPWTLNMTRSSMTMLSIRDMAPLSCSQECLVCLPFMVRNYSLNLKKEIKKKISQSLLSFKLSLSLCSPLT